MLKMILEKTRKAQTIIVNIVYKKKLYLLIESIPEKYNMII